MPADNGLTKGGLPADRSISRPCPPSLAPDNQASMTTPKGLQGGTRVPPGKIQKSSGKIIPFRFPWMKKVNSKGIPSIVTGTDDKYADMANLSPVKRSNPKKIAPRVKPSPKKVDLRDSDPFVADSRNHPVTPVHKNGDAESDGDGSGMMSSQQVDWMDESGGLDESGDMNAWEPSSGNNNMDITDDDIGESSLPPRRGMVLWHRKFLFHFDLIASMSKSLTTPFPKGPRMVEKLLLCVQYECHKSGVKIPWDKVVERLNPGSKGSSALQQLNKMRDTLVAEGHVIPPALGKADIPDPLWLRGYARDFSSVAPTATRSVRWSELIEHPKENLAVPGITRGSGNYRSIAKEERRSPPPKEVIDPAIGHRVRIPADVVEAARTARLVRNSAKKRKSRAQDPRVKQERIISSDDEGDPAEPAWDEEYTPTQKSTVKQAAHSEEIGSSPMVDFRVPSTDSSRLPAGTPNMRSLYPLVGTEDVAFRDDNDAEPTFANMEWRSSYTYERMAMHGTGEENRFQDQGVHSSGGDFMNASGTMNEDAPTEEQNGVDWGSSSPSNMEEFTASFTPQFDLDSIGDMLYESEENWFEVYNQS